MEKLRKIVVGKALDLDDLAFQITTRIEGIYAIQQILCEHPNYPKVQSNSFTQTLQEQIKVIGSLFQRFETE